jgi:hypothetical protein
MPCDDSAHDNVSGPDTAEHIRTCNRDHVFGCFLERVRDFGAEIALHPVHNAVDRCVQAIHAFEWNHDEDVIHLVVKLGNVTVPGIYGDAILHVFDDNVELAMWENNRMSRHSR